MEEAGGKRLERSNPSFLTFFCSWKHDEVGAPCCNYRQGELGSPSRSKHVGLFVFLFRLAHPAFHERTDGGAFRRRCCEHADAASTQMTSRGLARLIRFKFRCRKAGTQDSTAAGGK